MNPRRLPRRTVAAVLVVAAVALALAGCTSSGSDSPAVVQSSSPGSGIRGAQLSTPVALDAPASGAVFRTSAGGTTTLGALQRGKLMLLYFGYTSCPDVCPTTMADLGNALRAMSSLIQAHTQVVFVTSDPAFDTTARMKTWLANFDGGLVLPFIGLTASLKQIDSVADSVGVPLSPPVVEKNGTVSVEHGAQTLAFIDGKAPVEWLAGTTAADYEHDITQLVARVKSTP